MADIFISYSQLDRPLAHELADFLEDRGYDVWWDYDLVGGVNFRDKIMRELRAAKVAIVIWSQNSVGRDFVIDEADEAKSAKKLMPVRIADLDYGSIPLGFRQMQTDLVTRPDLILRSLEARGIVPSRPPNVTPQITTVAIGGGTVTPEALALSDEIASWGYVKQSGDPDQLRSFLSRYPVSDFAELARARLDALESKAWEEAQRAGSAEALVAFVLAYSEGRRTPEAKRLLYSHERRARSELDMNDPEALARFLKVFPSGFAADEVRTRINDLKRAQAEAEAWGLLQREPTRARLETYLKEFPLGRHARDAHQMLAPLETAERRAARWSKIKEQPFSEPLRSFIDEFVDGPEVEAARELLTKRQTEKENAAWAKLRDERSPVALLSFLDQFPQTVRQEEISARLVGWHEAVEREAWSAIEKADGKHIFQAFLMAFPSGKLAPEARKRAQSSSGWLGFGGPAKAGKDKSDGRAVSKPSPTAQEKAADVPLFLDQSTANADRTGSMQRNAIGQPERRAQLSLGLWKRLLKAMHLMWLLMLLVFSVGMGALSVNNSSWPYYDTTYLNMYAERISLPLLFAAISASAFFLDIYWWSARRAKENPAGWLRLVQARGLFLLLGAFSVLALASEANAFKCLESVCNRNPWLGVVVVFGLTLTFALLWYVSQRRGRQALPIVGLGIVALIPSIILVPVFTDMVAPTNYLFTEALLAWGGLTVAMCALLPFLIDKWIASRRHS